MSTLTLPVVLALAAQNGRVFPKPERWSRLYELLPNTRRDGYGFIPAAPLILGAWTETGDGQKNGALEVVHSYLRALPEDAWHHVGE